MRRRTGPPAYPRVLDELLPGACHLTEQYMNNLIEADHGRAKPRLRPMRGLKRFQSARVITAGHAFVQNLRRGRYELSLDAGPRHRLPTVFAGLAAPCEQRFGSVSRQLLDIYRGIRPDMMAGSGQVNGGLVTWRWSTATSWRRMRISTPLGRGAAGK